MRNVAGRPHKSGNKYQTSASAWVFAMGCKNIAFGACLMPGISSSSSTGLRLQCWSVNVSTTLNHKAIKLGSIDEQVLVTVIERGLGIIFVVENKAVGRSVENNRQWAGWALQTRKHLLMKLLLLGEVEQPVESI